MEYKVRIVLKAKKDFGSIKKNELLQVYNNLFDQRDGIAFFPIDKEQWTIIACDDYTGTKDNHDKEIYVNDIIESCYNEDQQHTVIKTSDGYTAGGHCLNTIYYVGGGKAFQKISDKYKKK